MDILGIDGIVYKGRLNSQATNGTATRGRDFPGRGAALGHRVSSSPSQQCLKWLRCHLLYDPASCPAANSASTFCPEGTKSPQPSAQHTAEKVRRNPKYGSQYVSPYSCECLSQVSHTQSALLCTLTPLCAARAVPHTVLFVLLCCRCCYEDKDGLLSGSLASLSKWQQDGRCMSWLRVV